MKSIIYTLLFSYVILAGLTIYFFDGTGDAGDSIQHYLFARYAPVHPELFFHHWAKPLYVLLSSPFAQFGFTGIKIFNAFVSFTTIFLTYKICTELNFKNSIIVVVILIFTPLYYILTFSGLTEPLFALFISAGIYAVLKEKYTIGCLIISFLPFVRSEGLIIIGVFAFYLLLKKKWKFLPLLLSGHLTYSFAGYFVYHDFFWVFNKIPYANMSSQYGSGTLYEFAEQLIYVIGVPLYILFWLGIVSIIWKSIKKEISFELQILVFLGFISYFSAHSFFWYLGIFNSMGLKRVMLGVMPLMAIIALQGFNFIIENIFEKYKNLKLVISGSLIIYIIIFPFTDNPAAVQWKRDMHLSIDQQCALQTADFIIQNKGKNHRFVFMHPYLSEALKIDCFDIHKKIDLTSAGANQFKQGDIIIWDCWFAVVEGGVTQAQLDSNSNLRIIYNGNFAGSNKKNIFSVYEYK